MGSNWCAVEGCFCGRTGAYFPNPDRGKISDDERQCEIVRLAKWIEFCGQPSDWKPDVRHQFVGWLHFDKDVVKECTRMKGGKEQRLRKLSKDAIPTIETIIDKEGNPVGGPVPDWYQRARESLRKEAIEEEYENRLLAQGNAVDSPKASTMSSSSPATSRHNSEATFRGGSTQATQQYRMGGEGGAAPRAPARKRPKPSSSPPAVTHNFSAAKARGSGGSMVTVKGTMPVQQQLTPASGATRVNHTSGGGGSAGNSSQAIIFGAKGAVQSSNFILKRLQEEITARKKLEVRVKTVERDVAFFKDSSKQFREIVENKQLREKLEEAQLELKLKQEELNRMCEEMSRITGTTLNRSLLIAPTSASDVAGSATLLPTMAITNAAGDAGDGGQRTLTAIYLQPPPGGSNNGVGSQHVLSNGGVSGADGMQTLNSADDQQHQYGSAGGAAVLSTVNPGYFTIGKLS